MPPGSAYSKVLVTIIDGVFKQNCIQTRKKNYNTKTPLKKRNKQTLQPFEQADLLNIFPYGLWIFGIFSLKCLCRPLSCHSHCRNASLPTFGIFRGGKCHLLSVSMATMTDNTSSYTIHIMYNQTSIFSKYKYDINLHLRTLIFPKELMLTSPSWNLRRFPCRSLCTNRATLPGVDASTICSKRKASQQKSCCWWFRNPSFTCWGW